MAAAPPEDPFDSLLSLESSFHAEGYALGAAEGSKTGRIEGRVFGLSRGFEKFAELGALQGEAAVWQARLDTPSRAGNGEERSANVALQQLKGSARLKRHVKRLVELTDAEAVVTENSEEGVEDFDERIKEVKAKALLVSRMIGEGTQDGTGKSATAANGEMEDFDGLPKGPAKQ